MSIIIIIIVVALISVVALSVANNNQTADEFGIAPADLERVFVGTTKLDGETVVVATGTRKRVETALKAFMKANEEAEGWRIKAAK